MFGAGVLFSRDCQVRESPFWLLNHWDELFVSVRHLRQFGPNSIREKKEVEQTIAVLEAHGWLSPCKGRRSYSRRKSRQRRGPSTARERADEGRAKNGNAPRYSATAATIATETKIRSGCSGGSNCSGSPS